MSKVLMSGNEAIARGAYEGGLKVGSAYPGTPSTEIFENLPFYKDSLYVEWAPNEKVAAEVAYGASIAGVRSLCAMKHVGINVAADPIFTACYNGVGRGYVIVSADDPSMHSSQNEQDNRHYARAAKMPMLEPSDSQECKDFMKQAFGLSEQFDLPLLFRVTTRVCHSKSLVELGERIEGEPLNYKRNTRKYIAAPANAYQNHPLLEQKLKDLEAYGNDPACPFNREEMGDGELGVITAGISYEYAKEVFPEGTSFLKLGLTYPLPIERIKAFAAKVKTLYVIEELDPFMEEQIKAAGVQCIGKEKVPLIYELNPEILAEAIFDIHKPFVKPEVDTVGRPPALCPGCPHRGFFYTLSKRKDAVISGDIGCYTLGASDPLNAMDSVICMGASVSAGHGMSKAFEMQGDTKKKVFAVIGDSTFYHSGLTGALNVIYNRGNVIPCILDNDITSMTGQQDNPGTGLNLLGEPAPRIRLEKLLEAIGFEHIIEVDPQDLKAMKAAVDEAVASEVPAAIITRRPCVLIKKFKRKPERCKVDRDACRACKQCLKVGCPAIAFKDGKSFIDPVLCVGCTVCLQVCPFNAIHMDDVQK